MAVDFAALGFSTARPERAHKYGADLPDGPWALVDLNGEVAVVTRHASKREAEWARKLRHAGPARQGRCVVGLFESVPRLLEAVAKDRAPKTPQTSL